MDDLIGTLQVANLRIYNGVIRKIRGLRCYLHVTNKRKILWTKRNPKTFAALGFFGGDYWTRTSDLLRVKYNTMISQNSVERLK